jgi:hypothetical protein
MAHYMADSLGERKCDVCSKGVAIIFGKTSIPQQKELRSLKLSCSQKAAAGSEICAVRMRGSEVGLTLLIIVLHLCTGNKTRLKTEKAEDKSGAIPKVEKAEGASLRTESLITTFIACRTARDQYVYNATLVRVNLAS